MFLDDYLKDNLIKSNTFRSGYLPLLVVFNKSSKSTPCRMVQCPNRQAVCRSELSMIKDKNKVRAIVKKGLFPEQNQNITNEQDSLDELTTQKPKFYYTMSA